MDQSQAALQQLKAKLLELGAEENELDQVIDEVNGVAIGRFLQEYFTAITDETIKQEVQNMNAEQLIAFIQKNPNLFPPLGETRLKEIIESTWKEYLTYMEEQ